MGKYGEHLTEAKTCLLLQPFMKAMAISKKYIQKHSLTFYSWIRELNIQIVQKWKNTRKPFVTHIQKRIFIEIIECSDVGIEPEMEEEMKEIKAYGLQLGETEDETEHTLKVKSIYLYIFSIRGDEFW